jgi:hypothetical protein
MRVAHSQLLGWKSASEALVKVQLAGRNSLPERLPFCNLLGFTAIRQKKPAGVVSDQLKTTQSHHL